MTRFQNNAQAASDLRDMALQALMSPDVGTKIQLALNLEGNTRKDYRANAQALTSDLPFPGRPARPVLTHPAKVPRRSPATQEGRAALIHAIAHIEFNAVNLALDAVWRFDDMPGSYYQDWAKVAREEAYHFSLLRTHLRSLIRTDDLPAWDYGDFPAHDNLWAVCHETRLNIVARMALVPRTMEARGLDATPQIQAKLRQVGTPDALRAVALLDIILKDEVGHVAIGNHWFRWLCQRDGHDPVRQYAIMAREFGAPRLKPPFNLQARQLAGFTPEELTELCTQPADRPGSLE